MWVCTRQNELYHHGIKGQKWGIRRYTNKDGSLNAAGKKRYYDDTGTSKKEKVSHRDKLVSKYKEQGYSEDDANKIADRRIKTEKVLLAVGAITVTAATAYVVKNQIDYKCDKILKEGTILQRIQSEKDVNLDQTFYSTYKEKDKTLYKGRFGNLKMQRRGEANNVSLKVKDNLKIASRKSSEDAFIELYKNDPEFRTNMFKSIDQMNLYVPELRKATEKAAKRPEKVSEKELRTKLYDAFNIALVNHTPTGNAASERFYEKLKEKGYDALNDVNDTKYSSFKAKAPTIIFNGKEKIVTDKIQEMTMDEIRDNLEQHHKDKLAEVRVNDLWSTSALAGAYVATLAGASTTINTATISKYRKEHPNSNFTDKEILTLHSDYVKQYKKEHPNSKMTDKEILDMMKKNKKLK